MENEPKKISFAFNKFPKKTNIILKPQPVEEKKVEIIEYLEEKSIKVVGNDDKPKGPLIIPMKHPNKKLINLVEIVKNDFQEQEPEPEEIPEIKTENGESDKNLTLEELAAKELLNDTKKIKAKEENKMVIEGAKNTEKITFEGEKESTAENYEEIPIEQFGKAMLRGMGWKDGHGIGKTEQLIKTANPIQRPKGMGLGADKMTKQIKTEKAAVDRDGNALKCVKGAYVKIIAGYHKGNYGQIIGLDDESGRFIIKTALNSINISLNEFLVSPVTKDDYNKNSKVINNAKYDEYVKKKELEDKIKLEEEKIKREKKSRDKSSDEDKEKPRRDKKDNDKKMVKKERKSSESDRCERRASRKEKHDKNDKEVKKERKSSESDYEDKYPKRTVKKERRSSESEEENRRNKRDKPEKSSKYDSDREDSRDRKNRDKYKQSTSKYSDSETEKEKRKSKKKSSKHDSDSEEYEQKKKHKKKKSKKCDDEDSDEKYRKKSKKGDRKKYDDSDSEDEKKPKKKDKKDKRDRSRHNKDKK